MSTASSHPRSPSGPGSAGPTPGDALTLFRDSYWISPYVYSAYVALREKGLEFAVSEVPLQHGAHREPAYAAPSLTGRVPALRHGDFWIAESSAIVEYLEDAFPAPGHARVLPEDVRDRARARQVMSWLRSDDTLPIRKERPTSTMFYDRATEPLTDLARRAVDKLCLVAQRLLAPSEAAPFGDFCVADADLAFMLQRLAHDGDVLPASVRAYAERVWARPSVQAFVQQPRPRYVPY